MNAIRLAHKAIEAAERVAAGPPIQWTPEQQADREQLKQELLRRVHEKKIGPLNASDPQSVTDTLQAYNDLHHAHKVIREAEAATHFDFRNPDPNPPVYQGIPGWHGEPCRDENHHGTVCGRCADCGKRIEKM